MTITFQENGQDLTQIYIDKEGVITNCNDQPSIWLDAKVDTSRLSENHPIYVMLVGETEYRKMNLMIAKVN